MCSAIGRAATLGQKWSGQNDRQLMVIVVTDESGDPADNHDQLEPAIAAAKARDCRVYFLSRQATFGYPYGWLQWRHPQTRRAHWLRMDNGPETAFVQTLQTDGFGLRRNAMASAFGSYEQMRVARETNGVLFMLPSVELGLSARQTPYTLEAMRNYRPDWRPRAEILLDRDRDPLQTQLCRVIADLNPLAPKTAKAVILKTKFGPSVKQLQT